MNQLGEFRASQLIFTFGVGSLIDLPNMSALVMGLDDWDTRFCTEISEDRLLAALQKQAGFQLKKLYLPPISKDDDQRDASAPAIGVPVAAFPRWLRCPVCDLLATIESNSFTFLQDKFRADKTRYVHNCPRGTQPTAHPVRFLQACREGHLTDFPWIEYVHDRRPICKPSILTLREYGAAGDASDVIVKCASCNVERRMGDAFDSDITFSCPGHHPHLRMFSPNACAEPGKTILLGASNSWFPVPSSVLSIPRATDKLARIIEENWSVLQEIPSLEVLTYVTAPSRMPAFIDFPAEAVWQAVQKKKASSEDDSDAPEDLKWPEWEAMSQPVATTSTKDFKLRTVSPPKSFETVFEDTVLVERLREVRALTGFTRIESNGDFTEATQTATNRYTKLSRNSSTWLPVSEIRGEGLFLRFREDKIASWEQEVEVQKLEREFFQAHKVWRIKRHIDHPELGFPGIRFILLHSLAHALMRQIALECGYTAASVRERLYCRSAVEEHGPMCGFLLYTASSDSEGTLGGLVGLGDPGILGRHISQALENLRLCASDPLCSEHPVSADGRGIHAACCHACLFAPETSCEKGNRYLDRNTLVQTFASFNTHFFDG